MQSCLRSHVLALVMKLDSLRGEEGSRKEISSNAGWTFLNGEQY